MPARLYTAFPVIIDTFCIAVSTRFAPSHRGGCLLARVPLATYEPLSRLSIHCKDTVCTLLGSRQHRLTFRDRLDTFGVGSPAIKTLCGVGTLAAYQ
jgi:hypothetical protein